MPSIYDNIASDYGGGVYNDLNASLTLAQSKVFQNTAYSGGGISNDGTLTISTSTIADNKAKAGGGVSTVGQMILLSSTFFGNTASDGGSIEILNDTEPARIVNCTISDNHVTGRGGGMEVSSSSQFLYFAYDTIYENGAKMGGGIYTDSPSIALAGNIIADNHAVTAADIQGTIYSFFGNLIQDFNGVSLLIGASRVAQPITGVQPKIGPLQDNGGPTKTRALLPGSPAIDQIEVILFGSDTICGGNSNIITDQRGVSRPQGEKCDLGAYEFVPSKK